MCKGSAIAKMSKKVKKVAKILGFLHRSHSYMIEIQRSMNLKEPLSGGASRYDQAMNGVNRGAH